MWNTDWKWLDKTKKSCCLLCIIKEESDFLRRASKALDTI